MHVEGPGRRFQSAGSFASPLDPSVHGSSASHQFHSKDPLASVSQQDTYSIDLFTHRPKLNKPIKNPADYDGTRLLCDYLKHFERCSVVNGWNQEEAALFLATGLWGEAQKVLNGMSDNDCWNYAKIVDKLELQFGVEKQCEALCELGFTVNVEKSQLVPVNEILYLGFIINSIAMRLQLPAVKLEKIVSVCKALLAKHQT